MIFALLLVAQVATAETVATCRVPDDPHQRAWSLERTATAWTVVFTSRSLDQPRVELPIPLPPHPVDSSGVTLFYASANGGRHIDWKIKHGASSLNLQVNHGLEVNVERDLDPAVDLMNTEGTLAVECVIPGAGNREPGAEPQPQPQPLSPEWQIAAGVARSVNLFQSTSGRAYAVQTLGYARELTGDLKFVGIRGRFAWGVEATPIFAQFSPSAIYGAGFAPVVWRWNFPPGPAWSVFAELSMGGLWTSEDIPENTGRLNFTAHWGGGVRRRWRGNESLLLAYRFQHFSNGNQLGSNPGVNSHVFLAGWSHRS